MDVNGKPRMSRDMMGRIMHSQPLNQPAAVGGAPSKVPTPAQRSLHARSSRVGGYGTSQLGARSFVRQFGTEISAPAKSHSDRRHQSQSGQISSEKRIDSQQNRPSAGFKEPPARGYNPYA